MVYAVVVEYSVTITTDMAATWAVVEKKNNIQIGATFISTFLAWLFLLKNEDEAKTTRFLLMEVIQLAL